MYGLYSRSLADYAKAQAAELRHMEIKSEAKTLTRSKKLRTKYDKWFVRLSRLLAFVWSKSFAKVGEDWVFLALLGMIMAIISYTMDSGIYMCNTGTFISIFYPLLVYTHHDA